MFNKKEKQQNKNKQNKSTCRIKMNYNKNTVLNMINILNDAF